MATSYNVDQNKLTLIDGLLTRLLTEQKVDLKIDSKNQLEVPSDIRKKIESMLKVRASLLSKPSNQKNPLATNKQTETLIGNFHFHVNQYDLAKIFYDKASKMDPKFVEPILNKGLLLARLGKNEESISYFDRVLENDPMHFDALCAKGDSLTSLSKT